MSETPAARLLAEAPVDDPEAYVEWAAAYVARVPDSDLRFQVRLDPAERCTCELGWEAPEAVTTLIGT